MNLEQHLLRQAAFSRGTYGPGERTAGVIDHIAKELWEIQAAEDAGERAKEWIDVVILGFDGLLRALIHGRGMDHETAAATAVRMLLNKQARNELRDWPDWRTAPADRAIEHVRTGEQP